MQETKDVKPPWKANSWLYVWLLYGPDVQGTAQGGFFCRSKTGAFPNPPPPVPTPAEVWKLTPLPDPSFHFSPVKRGLVQLPTWYWLSGVGGPVTATVHIRGYTVSTTASPTSYYWYFGDGGSAVDSSPGSQADPAATHTYTEKGGYKVQLVIAWTGHYTFTGYGVRATVQLGTVNGPTDAQDYGVEEVVGVGVGPS